MEPETRSAVVAELPQTGLPSAVCVAAVNRNDNVKTAVIQGAGAWEKTHTVYRAYARAVGFYIDACQPRQSKPPKK